MNRDDVDPTANNGEAIIYASGNDCLAVVRLLLECDRVDLYANDGEAFAISDLYGNLEMSDLLYEYAYQKRQQRIQKQAQPDTSM